MEALVDDFFREIDERVPPPGSSTSMPPSKKPTLSKGASLHGYEVAGTPWVPCFDNNSGCPYYWNQLTNEVCWAPPPEYVAAVHAVRKQQEAAAAEAVAAAAQKPSSASTEPESTKKARPKYPWEGASDSEDEKIELITSFGPQSGEESEEEVKPMPQPLPAPKVRSRTKARKKSSAVIGPQLPAGVYPQPQQTSASEDHVEVYETSSLLTPLVADRGPPGDESAPDSKAKNNQESKEVVVNECDDSSQDNCDDDILSLLKNKAKILQKIGEEVPVSVKELITSDNSGSSSPQQKPKIITKDAETVKSTAPTSSFALIANYGDDSDSEDIVSPEKKPVESKTAIETISKEKQNKPLFPIMIEEPGQSAKCLFPCASEETQKAQPISFKIVNKPSTSATSQRSFSCADLPDSASCHKAFQRKRRLVIEKPVRDPYLKYCLDPSANEYHGFGFNSLGFETPTELIEKQPYTFIQFVKGETINLQPPESETKDESSTADELIAEQTQDPINPIKDEEIGETAAVLREKLMFLGEGKEEVSAVQLMSVQLETLVSAWQHGALTPSFLCQWLAGRASELAENEKSAAPAGWTCSWDRERKRYCYHHEESEQTVWDYPLAPEDDGKLLDERISPPPEDQQEIAMELSETPPRVSSAPSSPVDAEQVPSPPPPPIISSRETPPPPSPPVISLSPPAGITADLCDIKKTDSFIISDAVYPVLPSDDDQPPPPGVDDVDLAPRPRLPAYSSDRPEVETNGTLDTPNPRKRSLLSELDSFYSDIAKLEEESSSWTAPNELSATSVENTETASQPTVKSEVSAAKKKKTSKLTTGLALKKKGVNRLVAKWEKVQKEVRQSMADDVTSTI